MTVIRKTPVHLAALYACGAKPDDVVRAEPARPFVVVVPSEPDWIERLRAPTDLDPDGEPLIPGELGTLDCGYAFKTSRPPVVEWPRRTGKASWLNAGATIEPRMVGVDMGSPDGDMAVYGKWEDGKLHVVERVKTGPGTPFARLGYRGQEDFGRQIGDAVLRREPKNQRMARQLSAMAETAHAAGLPIARNGEPADPEHFGTVSFQALSDAIMDMVRTGAGVVGAEWSGVPGDPFISLRRVRTEPFGTQPWDNAATEAS